MYMYIKWKFNNFIQQIFITIFNFLHITQFFAHKQIFITIINSIQLIGSKADLVKKTLHCTYMCMYLPTLI